MRNQNRSQSTPVEETGPEKFSSLFGTLASAGVGVMLVRTREPYRASLTLREWAQAKQRHFKMWTMLTGWQTFDEADPDAPPEVDNNGDVLAALKQVNGVGGTEPFPDGVYVLMWPHWMLKDSRVPAMVQCLADYAQVLPTTRRRVVIVTPLEFEVPEELRDMITLMDFDVPTESERQAIMSAMLIEGIPDVNKQLRYSDSDAARILSAAAGLTALEIENALGRAVAVYRNELPNVEVSKIVQVVLEVKTEAVGRSQVLELMPTVEMSEVGGLDQLKAWIEKRRACFTPEFKTFSGGDQVKGIAAIGPPGTGKSLVAKAIANTLGVPCIRFDVSRVFQSLIGASESRVRAALKLCESMAPCVVLLDEMDKAFDMNSSGGDSGVGKRVLGSILTFMQESKADVFWTMTANRTAGLPSELLRKGRLDEVFSLTVPTETERQEILRIHLAKRNQEVPDDLEAAVDGSNGYVAAELEAAVREAVVEAYHNQTTVTGALIAEQLSYMRPLSSAFAEQFAEMHEWATNNARPASSGTAALASPAAPPRRRRRSGNQEQTTPQAAVRSVDLDG